MQLVGRFAPSPTGLLHLGNAWAFLAAWLLCRREQGILLLRLEDIDPERSRKEYADRLVDDLRWLGLHWDCGYATQKDDATYIQSNRLPFYTKALTRLRAQGHIYPCFCSRKVLRSIVSAPHIDDYGAPYPGVCRDLDAKIITEHRLAGRKPTMRFRIPDGAASAFTFDDKIYGTQHIHLEDCGGDFALQRSDGVFAYQLAVAIDDADMRVTQVVRGRDILSSTARQLALLRCLEIPSPAYYAHIPLLCDASGQRLAKRHTSLTLAYLREVGCTAHEILGYLAFIMGLLEVYVPISPERLLLKTDPLRMGTHDVCLGIDPVADILAGRSR